MRLRRLFVSLGCLLTCFFFLGSVAAHGNKVGALVIDHPYAVENPEKPGEYAVYFKELKNTGTTPDLLQRAETAVATDSVFRTETHSVDHEITWVDVKSIQIAPGQSIVFRHDAEEGYQVQLRQLKRSLKVGDRFDMTLTFEKAGKVKVVVWVQKPRPGDKKHQH
jgi:copper(I)-binding protein